MSDTTSPARVSEIELPKAFRGLFQPHRNKAFHGGRSSAKSWSFATALVIRAAQRPTRIVCGREIQKSLRESVKQLIEDRIEALGLADRFDRQREVTLGVNGSQFMYHGLWRNPDAIKSLEGADIFWGEEASSLSARSIEMVRPTMRKPGSEMWWSWNPELEDDPIDRLFRGEQGPPPDSLVQEVSWRDNPWFEASPLKAQMEHDYQTDAGKAEHVWGGSYITAVEGAYYAQQLAEARAQGRVTFVSADPINRKRAFWDLGRRDATAIWVAQFVGREIRVLDYIEGSGQELGYYVQELHQRGYSKALMVLPHDGSQLRLESPGSAQMQLKAAGFDVDVIPNQGAGAAMQRVEATRRLFPQMWFNETTTRPGLKALAAYHERRDPKRNVGLGPEHDAASDPADAFGLMAIAYKPPSVKKAEDKYHRDRPRGAPSAWAV